MTATTDELRTVITALWADRDDPTVQSELVPLLARLRDIETAPTPTEPTEGSRGTH